MATRIDAYIDWPPNCVWVEFGGRPRHLMCDNPPEAARYVRILNAAEACVRAVEAIHDIDSGLALSLFHGDVPSDLANAYKALGLET